MLMYMDSHTYIFTLRERVVDGHIQTSTSNVGVRDVLQGRERKARKGATHNFNFSLNVQLQCKCMQCIPVRLVVQPGFLEVKGHVCNAFLFTL